MRVLGIDPGTGRVGWAIVEKEKGKENLVAAGCIETKVHTPLLTRLELIFKEVGKLVEKYRPDETAVEELYFYNNAKTAMTVGQARGVILLALQLEKLPIYAYTPLQVKMAVTGFGQADKQQMQKMVKIILKLEEIIRPDDAADAAAVCLTHLAVGRRMSVRMGA